jgi:hypothetical protein
MQKKHVTECANVVEVKGGHKFWKVSALVYLLYKVTMQRTFENFCTAHIGAFTRGTFYTREHILYKENTFYKKRTHSI